MSMEQHGKRGAAKLDVESSRHDPRREYVQSKAFGYKVLSHAAYREYLQRKPLPPIPIPIPAPRPATSTTSPSSRRQCNNVFIPLPSAPRTVVRQPVRPSSSRNDVSQTLKQTPVLEDAWCYRKESRSPTHDMHLYARLSPAESDTASHLDVRPDGKGRTTASEIRIHTASKSGTLIAPPKSKRATGDGKPDKPPSPPFTPTLESRGQGGRLADLSERIRRLSGSLRGRADSIMSMLEQSPEGVAQKSSADKPLSQSENHKGEKVAQGLKIRHVHSSVDIHLVPRESTKTANNDKESKQESKGHRCTKSSPCAVPSTSGKGSSLSPWSSPRSLWSVKSTNSAQSSGNDANMVDQQQLSTPTRVMKAKLALSDAVYGLLPRRDNQSLNKEFSFGAHQPVPTVNLNRCVRCGRCELDWVKARHELCGECCNVEVGLGWPF